MKDKRSSFQPVKYKEKAHLDLMYLLIKQAFPIRYPNEQLIEIPVVNPEVSSSSNCRQPLEAPQLRETIWVGTSTPSFSIMMGFKSIENSKKDSTSTTRLRRV